MNEDKIILPAFLIADLYKESLVDLTNSPVTNSLIKKTLPEKKEAVASSDKITYYGENSKNITIVVNYPGSTHINKEDLSFLSNILKACQLNTLDIAIVNTSKQQVNYSAIKEQLNASKILLFDIEPSVISLPFKIPPFQAQYYDSCTIMLAPALSALNKQTQEGKLLKTKLWNSLKQVFGIS